jgi:hypothetical protein
MFDASEFMQTQMDKPLETEYTLVPIGEYMMTIDDFTKDAFEVIDFTYKQGPLAGTPGSMTKVTLPFIVQDDRVKRELQRDKVTVSKQLILEFEDDGKTIASGPNKNIELGRIRAAVGQDKGPWSFAMLRGAGPLMGKVTHVEYQRKDGTKGKRAEIERVTRIV